MKEPANYNRLFTNIKKKQKTKYSKHDLLYSVCKCYCDNTIIEVIFLCILVSSTAEAIGKLLVLKMYVTFRNMCMVF
jgi:hypothetical protein